MVIDRIHFDFEVVDYNPNPNMDGTKEVENVTGTHGGKEFQFDTATIGDPYAQSYELNLPFEEDWDEHFQRIWKFAGNNGIYRGGEWTIHDDFLREEYEGDCIMQGYSCLRSDLGVPNSLVRALVKSEHMPLHFNINNGEFVQSASEVLSDEEEKELLSRLD